MKKKFICIVLFQVLLSGLVPPAFGALRLQLKVKNRRSLEYIRWPVTSGVPLPEGSVFPDKAAGQPPLRLRDDKGREIPAQFKVLSRWPDGSIKWVLLDFQVSVPEERELPIFLEDGGQGNVKVSPLKIIEDKEGISVDTGVMKFTVSKKRFNLFDEVTVGTHKVVTPAGKNGVWLTGTDNTGYSSYFSPPDKVIIEERGPLRTVILVQGKFKDAKGKGFMPETARYNARIHTYANQSFVRIFLTIENNGRYGFNLDNKPGEPYSFRELNLQLRLKLQPKRWIATTDYDERYSPKERFFLYQRRRLIKLNTETENFSYLIKRGDKLDYEGKRHEGWIDISDSAIGVTVAVRHFWQNYPKSIVFSDDTLSLGLWPIGGKWPPLARENYRFRPGTHKTYELLFSFYQKNKKRPSPEKVAECFRYPLMATAPPRRHSDYQSFWTIAPKGEQIPVDKTQAEAFQRYEKLQACKVHLEEAEEQHDEYPPSTLYTERENRGEGMDWYGWMNFGDIPWGGNSGEGAYCSGHYDWPYGLLLQFLRTGDPAFFDLAEEMTLHRMDIDQYHTSRGSSWLNNFQWNEFGNHDRGPEPWEPNPSHSWVQGLVLYYLLTGNRKSLEAAEEVILATNYYWTHQWGGEPLYEPDPLDNAPGSAELRIQGWGIENLLTFWKLTNERKYLASAIKIWRQRTLPFITPAGFAGPKEEVNVFQLVLVLEPLIKLDKAINDEDLRDAVLRILDFLINRVYAGGRSNQAGQYQQYHLPYSYNAYTGFKLGVTAAYNFMTSNALAYAYQVSGDPEYLKLARLIFRDAVFYWQKDDGFLDPKMRSPIAYAAAHFPGSRSKVHGWINRYPQLYLYLEGHPKQDTIPPGVIQDLEVVQLAPDTVRLDWTATGDDGDLGQTVRYQVKYSTKGINSELEWLQAVHIKHEPKPSPPQNLQQVTIRSLEPKKTYFFAIRAYDEEDNRSPISNVAAIKLE